MPIKEMVLKLEVPDVDHMRDFSPEERAVAWAAINRLMVGLVNMLHDATTCSNSNIKELDVAKKMEKQVDAMRYEIMKLRYPQHALLIKESKSEEMIQLQFTDAQLTTILDAMHTAIAHAEVHTAQKSPEKVKVLDETLCHLEDMIVTALSTETQARANAIGVRFVPKEKTCR